jgi:hypothetical protein
MPRWRWRVALLTSLALHGLTLFGLSRLPGGAAAALPAAAWQGSGEAAVLGDESEPVCFLVQRSPPPKPKPLAVPVRPLPYPPVPLQPSAAAVTGPGTARPQPGPLSKAGGGSGKGGSTTFFGVPTPADAVVYVLDHSASMGLGGRLAAAKQQLLASLEQLPPTARFQVIVYNSKAQPLLLDQPGMMPATTANKQRIASALHQLRAEGGTHHDQALLKALALRPAVVFFLTDADDLSDDYRLLVTRLNRHRTIIHTIELDTANLGRPAMPLQALARENGGTYQAVDVRHWHGE